MGGRQQTGKASGFGGRGLLAALLAALLLTASTSSLARDLGVVGKVWPISEIDIRELLIASASRADLGQLQEELRESAQEYLNSLPKRPMDQASTTRTRWIDPSFVLSDDIAAPVQNARGEWQWRILYKKGTRFNPLTVQRPHNAMLFFNGTASEEVAFVRAVYERYPAKVMLIEATGTNPEKLAKELGIPVFSATETMLGRFRIATTPSLLYAGEGPHALELGLTEFAPPFSTLAVEQVWPSIKIGTGGSN